MHRKPKFLPTMVALVLLGCASSVMADVTWTGEVEPTDPTTWTFGTKAYIGSSDFGTLTVDAGSSIRSSDSYIGNQAGGSGEVTITGPNSLWSTAGWFGIGGLGTGRLAIVDGANVSSSYATHLAPTGELHLDQGTLTTGLLYAASENLTGTGTIHTEGLVSDLPLVFDATHGLTFTHTFNDLPDQNIELHVDLTDGLETLGIGLNQMATMSIADGVELGSGYVFLGHRAGSHGVVDVSGAGSRWTVFAGMRIANEGDGTMTISEGAAVTCDEATIGAGVDTVGVVDVDGVDSTWNVRSTFHVGGNSSGSLTIASGAAVTSGSSVLGDNTGSFGRVELLGQGSSWGAGEVKVGAYGAGELLIAGGASLRTGDCYAGRYAGSTGEVIVEGPGTNWTFSRGNLFVARAGAGTVTIRDGANVSTANSTIGADSTGEGELFVDGEGSQLVIASDMRVGYRGTGLLSVTNGAYLESGRANILGYDAGSMGHTLIAGPQSYWKTYGDVVVGEEGPGTLEIVDGGLVSIRGDLTIDSDADGDSWIDMATGGMLAINGMAADSLAQFLDLVAGTDLIRYWDAALADWAPLTAATIGEDYTLEVVTEGALESYTMLTVGTLPTEPTPGDFNGDGLVSLAGLHSLARSPRRGRRIGHPPRRRRPRRHRFRRLRNLENQLLRQPGRRGPTQPGARARVAAIGPVRDRCCGFASRVTSCSVFVAFSRIAYEIDTRCRAQPGCH